MTNDMQNQYRRWQSIPQLSLQDLTDLETLKSDADAFHLAFSAPLHFGTAGLRGRTGPGPGQMNAITVMWASAGMSQWLIQHGKTNATIIICGDSRLDSADFSQIAARTLVSLGHRVILSEKPAPTPVLSWAVRHYKADAGIVITASHNPKEFNGFKAYGANGCQLLAKDANVITDAFCQFAEGKELADLLSLEECLVTKHLQFISDELIEAYLDELLKTDMGFVPTTKDTDDLNILYTPLHGTGGLVVPKAFQKMGFLNVQVVENQLAPDGNFPTLPTPNPENAIAFDEALKLTSQHPADLIIATDPDCDRMGCAVYDIDRYRFLTGNQIAALMIDYLSQYTPCNQESAIVTTVVSSQFGKQLAQSRGMHVYETLTGFKHIGTQIDALKEDPKKQFFFAYEESFGYLYGDHARDKDGVVASLVIALAMRALKLQGKSLSARLNELYQQTGPWHDYTFDLRLPENGAGQVAASMLEKIRQNPTTIIQPELVAQILDYKHGLANLPPENMLKYQLSDGSEVTIRPSGTEAKIKCYIDATAATLVLAEQRANELVKQVQTGMKQLEEISL